MSIIERHNILREREGLAPFIENNILNEHALRSAKWMARRRWSVFWNFDSTRKLLINQGFLDIEYNIALGPTEERVLNHFLNDADKKNKLYGNYKYIGFGIYTTEYSYWAILYAN